MTNKEPSFRETWRELTFSRKTSTLVCWLLTVYLGWHVGSWYFLEKLPAFDSPNLISAFLGALIGAAFVGVLAAFICAMLLAFGLRLTHLGAQAPRFSHGVSAVAGA